MSLSVMDKGVRIYPVDKGVNHFKIFFKLRFRVEIRLHLIKLFSPDSEYGFKKIIRGTLIWPKSGSRSTNAILKKSVGTYSLMAQIKARADIFILFCLLRKFFMRQFWIWNNKEIIVSHMTWLTVSHFLNTSKYRFSWKLEFLISVQRKMGCSSKNYRVDSPR